MNAEQAAALRAPFPPEAIGKLPKAGIKLDYVGHAGVTDRLLSVDPDWTWEPMATNEYGVPLITAGGLWIRMTVCGVTRPGWGDGPDIKQMISDAIRNAAMRFGVALDLWSKEDLHAIQQNAEGAKERVSADGADLSTPPAAPSATSPRESNESARAANGPESSSPPSSGPTSGRAVTKTPSKHRRDKLKSKCVALQADGVSVADAREELKLPLVDSCNDEQLARFESLVADLEAALEAPFAEAKS